MTSLQIKNSYSEVFELLKHTDRKDLNKIPMNVLEKIKENRNKDYAPQVNYSEINLLSKNARAVYIWLYLTYIADSQEEKNRIYSILYNNETKKTGNLKLFDKPSNVEQSKENNQLIVVNKTGIFERIINKIKKFLKNRRK